MEAEETRKAYNEDVEFRSEAPLAISIRKNGFASGMITSTEQWLRFFRYLVFPYLIPHAWVIIMGEVQRWYQSQ